jgi:hypothetical protein
LEPVALLMGAVLRLYVRVGFLARAGAPNDVVDGAVNDTGAGAGWTDSYGAGDGTGDGAGLMAVDVSNGGNSIAFSTDEV